MVTWAFPVACDRLEQHKPLPKNGRRGRTDSLQVSKGSRSEKYIERGKGPYENQYASKRG